MPATTHTFRVEGMHCASCSLLIDDALEDLPGVRSTRTTLKQGRTTVELDLSRNSPRDVVRVIEELGYRASPLP
ncbi:MULTISPECIES: heavy-metal-associated domain-containing protein [Parafrankia]|uniref:Heavy metal transporter n=1 Tax=Parafrankia soli TaxID=2599596 RepID=A0A1S1PIU8_9ACTN|nr:MULTISPECIES: heavy metal-associated domain-containing protein [Parafrankia]OHV20999.1 heavy metal transporter [Parafrankia soli]TCJ35592.1 heavy-metal-associated domain-containing protein [Parafrankia sp. BMG5.11]CAI7977347.1 Heavy metal transport/detoxification protein [Frankia sp. Hr75.2]SQD97801.1 Heavy metal transport/detoxification protein [Parafrankia sp. Ea1.12]